MNIRNFLWFTGIWLFPPALAVFYLLISILGLEGLITIVASSVLASLLPITMLTKNIERFNYGERDFSLKSTLFLGDRDERRTKEYMKAAYPDVPPKYVFDYPTGIIVGKQKKKYVAAPISRDGMNIFCVGNVGTGKSVLLLGWLYALIHRDQMSKKNESDSYNFFMVDIKGELFEKVLHVKSKDYSAKRYKDLQVVMPSNRSSYGWDVFYLVRGDNVSETMKIKAVNDIAEALVMETGDNPYFSVNARKILSGVLLYGINEKMEFLPIIQMLLRTPLNELLETIVADAEAKHYTVVLDKLKGFVGKEDNESLADIESTLKMVTDVFSYPDIQYCLHENTMKTSPAALNDGVTNLDLTIEEAMLEVYKPIFRLITMQVLKHCEMFREEDVRRTVLLFDEAARIGKIEGLDSAMATLRSRHTSLVCFFQSISQFKDIYPEHKANTLLNLCEIKIFLSGGDKDTTDYVSNMAGKYEVTKTSYKNGGILKRDTNYSKEQRDIVEGKDLMSLREKNEAICFVFGHYMRLKKFRYFEDPILKKYIYEDKR